MPFHYTKSPSPSGKTVITAIVSCPLNNRGAIVERTQAVRAIHERDGWRIDLLGPSWEAINDLRYPTIKKALKDLNKYLKARGCRQTDRA